MLEKAESLLNRWRQEHLGPDEIEVQSGVHFAHLGGVVAVPVVAAGKTGDGVHVGHLQTLLPQLFVEGFADARDHGRSVEIQVHLPETKFVSAHVKPLSSLRIHVI